MKRILCGMAAVIMAVVSVGCGAMQNGADNTPAPTGDQLAAMSVEGLKEEYDFSFSKRDLSQDIDTAVASILLADGATSVTGTGVTVDGNVVTITDEGVYIVSGELTDGCITVEADKEDKVQLVFDGVSISSNSGSPMVILTADKVFITVLEGTENFLSDGEDYPDEEIDACVYSKEDLTINGTGSLTVQGNYKHGIVSKDDLVVAECALAVAAPGDGVRGKDALKICEAVMTVTAGGDGMLSDNSEDSGRGYVYMQSGAVAIAAGADGIQAQNVIYIADGAVDIAVSGTDEYSTLCGMSAEQAIAVTDGVITLDARDDGISCGGDIGIDGGSITISAGDDGIHSDTSLVINGGEIRITSSLEALEAANITVNGGRIDAVSDDDGMNAAGGSDAADDTGGRPRRGGMGDGFAADADAFIAIHGGYIWLDAGGDGVDSNGSFTMSGGTLLISGSMGNDNSAIDYQTSGTVSGGVVVAIGSVGMAQSFESRGSAQSSISCRFQGTMDAGTMVTMKNADGRAILSFTAPKQFQSVVISCPELASGEGYEFFVGGTVSEADEHGFAYGDIGLEGGESVGMVTAG